ncbi:MAG: hypothetical protein FWG27_06950 [Treponema sp.]|nr:hypothetical protein [Treponema sp.]
MIGLITDHREREEGAIIYPVYSRRSGGLSIGVNLFPGRKICSFDCPYCEVFPFESDITFNMETMKAVLASVIIEAQKNGIAIKDICFSGNGEPTMAPFFMEVTAEAAAIRAKLVPEAKLVLITNGSGLLNPVLFEFLKTAALSDLDLHIWLKFDAGTEAWYRVMDRSDIPYEKLISSIRNFAVSSAPFTIQTMLCAVKGALPPPEETAAWIQLVTELAALSAAGRTGGMMSLPRLRAVQIYGKARPAPEDPLAGTVSVDLLEERAALLRLALEKVKITVPVEVYE